MQFTGNVSKMQFDIRGCSWRMAKADANSYSYVS